MLQVLKMEGKQELSYGGVNKGDEAPDSYRLTPRIENPRQHDGSTATAVAVTAAPEAPAAVGSAVPGASPDTVKKKRGRPRKYGPDGAALSPMPLSASIPLAGDYPQWKQGGGGDGRPAEKIKKKHKFLFDSPGDKIALFVGGNFTPHLITVNPGEDIAMKIMSFSQQGARAICVLSANGTISNVTLRQPTSCGGTLTYEGRFEILSLSGSYTPKENAGTMSRSGGMSVSLAGPDGRVLGGGLAGLLIAAGPVQVVLASFLPGHLLEPKPKKQRKLERTPLAPTPPTPQENIINREEPPRSHGGKEPNIIGPASVYNGQNPMNYSNNSSSETTKSAFFMEESNGGLS